MPRPRLCRHIRFRPQATFFKPRGIPLRHLKITKLNREEAEALRLKNIENLDQVTCAKRMKTSQSTFQRILTSAYKKTSRAIIKGQAIEIENK